MTPFKEWLRTVAQFTGVLPESKGESAARAAGTPTDNASLDRYRDSAERLTGDQSRIPGERYGR